MRERKLVAGSYGQGKLAYYTRPKQKIPTYAGFMEDLDEQRKDTIGKPHYKDAVDAIHDSVRDWVERHGLSENQEVSEDFVNYIDGIALEAVERFKVHDKSGLYAWATTRKTILDLFRKRAGKEPKESTGLTVEGIPRIYSRTRPPTLWCSPSVTRLSSKSLR